MLDDPAAGGLRQGAHPAGARLLTTFAEPQRRLPRAARTYWAVHAALQVAPLLAAAYVGRELLDAAGLADLPSWSPFAVAAAFAVVMAGLVPVLSWRRWRYEVHEDAIDLRQGAVVVRRTVVPMRRVQHVDTASGPLQGLFDLATVTFHTAAGPVAIPALTRGEAETVRRRVSELAQALDDV